MQSRGPMQSLREQVPPGAISLHSFPRPQTPPPPGMPRLPQDSVRPPVCSFPRGGLSGELGRPTKAISSVWSGWSGWPWALQGRCGPLPPSAAPGQLLPEAGSVQTTVTQKSGHPQIGTVGQSRLLPDAASMERLGTRLTSPA